MNEMPEKPKKDVSRLSKLVVWGSLGFLAFICFGICGVLVMPLMPFFSGQILQTRLSSELIPTAEALMLSPREIPFSRYGEVSLQFMENGSGSEDAICIYVYYPYEAKRDVINANSNLYIDGVWVFGASISRISYLDISAYYEGLDWCASGELQAGLHLIEFHLKDSLWAEPIRIQQWAIRIEE